MAEHAGHSDPQRMQRLLRKAVWDADRVRDDTRDAVHALGCAQVHGRQAVVVAFDPDWRTDGEVQVWDLTTGAVVTMLAGHEAWVRAVVCTEVNGRAIAITASRDETVRIWDLASSTEIALLDYTGRALCVSSTQEVVIGTGWGLTVVDQPADVSE